MLSSSHLLHSRPSCLHAHSFTLFFYQLQFPAMLLLFFWKNILGVSVMWSREFRSENCLEKKKKKKWIADSPLDLLYFLNYILSLKSICHQKSLEDDMVLCMHRRKCENLQPICFSLMPPAYQVNIQVMLTSDSLHLNLTMEVFPQHWKYRMSHHVVS